MDMKRLIAVARGDAPADLVFTNARIVNTFTGEVEEGSVAVAEGRGGRPWPEAMAQGHSRRP